VPYLHAETLSAVTKSHSFYSFSTNSEIYPSLELKKTSTSEDLRPKTQKYVVLLKFALKYSRKVTGKEPPPHGVEL
jgi:hypothetical protein